LPPVLIIFHLIQQEAKVGVHRRTQKQCKGKYEDRGNPCFVILTLWDIDQAKVPVVQIKGKEPEKVEHGYVVFWNWVSKCCRYAKVHAQNSRSLH
jgi:hypothetical protein